MRLEEERTGLLNLKVGDRWLLSEKKQPERPFGAPIKPGWFVCSCATLPSQMQSAKAHLRMAGALCVWFPEERRRIAKPGGGRKLRFVPAVPGLLFVLLNIAPNWSVIARTCKVKPYLLCGRNEPTILGDEAIAMMGDQGQTSAFAI